MSPTPAGVDTDQRPFVLIWELTQACDLACKHCRAEAEPERHPDELTTAEAKTFLDDVRDFADGQLVVFSGGDPLAREDTVDLVEYGVDRGLQVTMTPSGTASLTRNRIDELADAGLRRMALSIDGATASTHDEFRQERGSFAETMDAARAASDAGLPLQVNTTVCAETIGELPAIREVVADLGAVLWSVFFLVPVGRGAVLDPISPDRAEDVMAWLHEVQEAADFGIKTTEAPHYRRVALQQTRDRGAMGSAETPADPPGVGSAGGGPGGSGSSSGGPRGDGSSGGGPPGDGIGRSTGITAGDGFAFVSHVGDVFPSGFLPKAAGNVRDRSIVDIYRSAPLFERLRDRSALEGKCGACEFRHVCGGSRSRAFATTGNPLASDPLCGYVPEGYDGDLPQAWNESRTGSETGSAD